MSDANSKPSGFLLGFIYVCILVINAIALGEKIKGNHMNLNLASHLILLFFVFSNLDWRRKCGGSS